MDNITIGKFIAQCRKEKNMTQAQLAEKLSVSDKSVSRWENGRTMPDISLYQPLCDILDISVSELLYGRHMESDEKNVCGERSALEILSSAKKLKALAVLTDILIAAGIIVTVTFTKLLAQTPVQMAVTVICGSFVWIFGIIIRTCLNKALYDGNH